MPNKAENRVYKVYSKRALSAWTTMLRSIAALAGASAVAAHGGMTTPLPRNSFNQPLDPSQPAVFGDMTNYYDVSVALPGSPRSPLSHPSLNCMSGSVRRR